MIRRDTKECGVLYKNDFDEEHIQMKFYPKFKDIDILIYDRNNKLKIALSIDLTTEASEKLTKDIEKSLNGGKEGK